ncbi:50S ribosomal protein L18 [Candidatus Nitrososphaera sp. FF02]|uniref:50S ribosomal protein L18 n=1 Tax=Candidatus Nitrososphaera sp. FF02 TaxID=3398226 RepID=UPI0039EC9571
MTYVRTLKRIRLDKTNYRKRAAIIIGRHSFATVKVTDQNVAAQMLKPTPTGDLVIASAHSHELAKHGWKGSTNSLPACYLTGLLMGKKALAKGSDSAVLYIGKDHFTTRVAACAKGIADSGVNMPVSEESFPDEERISGQHIADYAQSLKENAEEYKSRFSALLKNGLNPEDYPSHFEEIKAKISGKAPEAKPKEAPKKEAKPAKEDKALKEEKAPKKEAKPAKEKPAKKEAKGKKPAKGGKKKQ